MQGSKVLVVDDEAHITHVVSLKLRNAGCEVMTAGDGEEGYELACQHLPDLIITDLQMPYMNGVEMCAKLRETHATEHIPVLMLTARGYSLAPEDYARTNIREILSKPFSPREVLEKVQAALAGRSSAGEAEAA
ncbi:MAG: response regulator [Planctomycetota bacterium]|nr:response regulator [Planctomycetota bacterium]